MVAGRHLEHWKWGSSHHSQNCYSLCLNFVQNSMVLLNSCFPSGSLEFGLCHIETMGPAPSKNLGTKFPWWTTIHACCHSLLLGGIKHTLCVLKVPGLCSMCLFPSPFWFVFFELELSLIHKDRYVLTPPGVSSKLGCGLGDLWHKRRQVMISSYHVEPPFIILFSKCKN